MPSEPVHISILLNEFLHGSDVAIEGFNQERLKQVKEYYLANANEYSLDTLLELVYKQGYADKAMKEAA